MRIEKKILPEYFEKVLSGEKNFELRLADWRCDAGDILVLKEWNPNTSLYSGRKILKKVGYVLKTKNLNFFSDADVKKYGYQVIGFK